MRLPKWLIVAGLGLGLLTHADSDAEQSDILESDDGGRDLSKTAEDIIKYPLDSLKNFAGHVIHPEEYDDLHIRANDGTFESNTIPQYGAGDVDFAGQEYAILDAVTEAAEELEGDFIGDLEHVSDALDQEKTSLQDALADIMDNFPRGVDADQDKREETVASFRQYVRRRLCTSNTDHAIESADLECPFNVHRMSHESEMELERLFGYADDDKLADREAKPEPPRPQDLVSKFPTHVTLGWKTKGHTVTNGHHWSYACTVTATKPTEFILTYSDHHHQTMTALGEYNSANTPHVTISASRKANGVPKKVKISANARDALPTDALEVLEDAKRVLLIPVWLAIGSFQGNPVLAVGRASKTTPPYEIVMFYISSEKTITQYATYDPRSTPVMVTETIMSGDKTWGDTRTLDSEAPLGFKILGLPGATAPAQSAVTTQSHIPVHKRFHDILPSHITPGQKYTHISASTTAVIKVKATEPDTEFVAVYHSRTATRTCNARVDKTTSPPLIIQTVTGSNTSFVQTDIWGPRKARAFLPHADTDATELSEGINEHPTGMSSATVDPNGTSITGSSHAKHTVTKTHIMTTTIHAPKDPVTVDGGTLTVTRAKTIDAMVQHWTVTATRNHGRKGLFEIPSASPEANLHASKCSRNKLYSYRQHPRMGELLSLSLDELRLHYHHLGWAYIQALVDELKAFDEEMTQAEAAALAIICMKSQVETLDACPCNGGADRRNDRMLDVHPHMNVTTEFIARLNPSTMLAITPPTTIISDGQTYPFVLAASRSRHHSHSTRSHDQGTTHTRHATTPRPTAIRHGRHTMTVVLEHDLRTHSRRRPHFPGCEAEYMFHHNCSKKADSKSHKHECDVERCMWNFLKPINITTAIPAVMYDDRGAYYDYFTHTTHISGRPHWGTTESAGIYYPLAFTDFVNTSDTCTSTSRKFVRQMPPPATKLPLAHALGRFVGRDHKIHPVPDCWNRKTCQAVCEQPNYRVGLFGGKTMVVISAVLAALFALSLLACCGGCILALIYRRRKRHAKRDEATGNPVAGARTVDPVTGMPIDPASGLETVAVTSTAVPATAAAAAKPGSRNAGTFGRQAEEGRGRVHFPDGNTAATAAGAGAAGGAAGEQATGGEKGVTGSEAPAGAASTVVSSEKAAEVPAEHVEAVPAHDGADSRRTGSEMADMGSMRGRRPMRQKDEGLI